MLKAIYRRRAILLSYLWLYIYWLTAKAEDNKVPIEKTTQHVCGVCRPVDYGYSVYFHLLLLFLSSSLLPARLRLFCADSGEGPRQSDIDWEPFSPSRVFLSTAHTHTHGNQPTVPSTSLSRWWWTNKHTRWVCCSWRSIQIFFFPSSFLWWQKASIHSNDGEKTLIYFQVDLIPFFFFFVFSHPGLSRFNFCTP